MPLLALAGRGALLSPAALGHLPLLLVVERQAERIPEGHQRPLHGVGFGLLEGGLMGLAQIDVDAVAGTAALANHWGLSGGATDGDAHPGGVGDTPAGPSFPAWAPGTDGALGLVDAVDLDGFSLPAIEPEDPIGFRDHLPALQIADLGAALLALPHLGAIEGGAEGGDLLGGEGAGHGSEGVSGRRDRDQWAEV